MNLEYKDSPLGNIPIEWDVVKLEEVCLPKEGMRRGPFGGAIKKEFFVEKGYQVYEQRNAIYDDFVSARYFIDEEKYEELKAFQIQENDFIISCSGTIGKIAKVPKTHSKGVINQALLRLRLDRTKMTDDYFLQQFRDVPFQNKITDSVQGGAMKNLVGMSEFRKTLVTLPPLPEQQKIAEILSTVDAKIELIDQQITETQALKKGLMQRLLTKGIGHTEFKDSALGEIPKSWEVVKIGDVLKLGSGKDYKHLGVGTIPVYGTGGIMTYVDNYLFDGESVGIGRKGTIDKPVLLKDKFWTVDTLFYTHSFNNITPYFVYIVFQSIKWRGYSEATGVPSLSKNIIEPINIPLPTIDEQVKISNIFTSIDSKLEVLSEKKKHYQELKQGLMQKLLTGKIRVNINNAVTV